LFFSDGARRFFGVVESVVFFVLVVFAGVRFFGVFFFSAG
jgi:hypothetical protein